MQRREDWERSNYDDYAEALLQIPSFQRRQIRIRPGSDPFNYLPQKPRTAYRESHIRDLAEILQDIPGTHPGRALEMLVVDNPDAGGSR